MIDFTCFKISLLAVCLATICRGQDSSKTLNELALASAADVSDHLLKVDSADDLLAVEECIAVLNRMPDSPSIQEIIIADAHRRILLWHLASYLVKNPEKWQASLEYLRRIPKNELAKQDALIGLLFPVSKPRESANLDSLLAQYLEAGKRHAADLIMAYAMKPELARTTNLLSKPVPDLVVYRLGETDFYENLLLPGLIDYLSRGGTVTQLKDIKASEFAALFSDNPNKYFSAYYGIRAIDAANLENFVKSLQKKNHHFLSLAVQ